MGSRDSERNNLKADTGGWSVTAEPASVEVLIGRSAAILLPEEVLKHELAVDERIDVMIDRAIKRSVQTKAMKQMLDRSSPTGGYERPKIVQSSKPNGSAKVVNHKGKPRADSG